MSMRRVFGGVSLLVVSGGLVLLPFSLRASAAAGGASDEDSATTSTTVANTEPEGDSTLVAPPDGCGGATSDAPHDELKGEEGRPAEAAEKLIPESGKEPTRPSIEVSVDTVSGSAVDIVKRQQDEMLQLVGTLTTGAMVAITFEHTALCGDGAIEAKVNADGSAYIVRATADGVPEMIGVAEPWAIDATGAVVPTWYTADGSTLVQVVDARDRLAPITFDPTYSSINCLGYYSDRDARDYLNISAGNIQYCAPAGMFYAANGYLPVFGYEANVNNDYGRVALRQDGSCSPPGTNTGYAWDFQVPCKSHDFCYDLRKASFSGTVSDSACDSAFYDVMEAHCNDRILAADCRLVRDAYYLAVRAPFVVTNPSPGVVYITNGRTGKCMDIEGPSTANVPIQQWDCADVSQMTWRIWPQSGYPGQFKIVSEYSDKCVAPSPIYNVVVQQVCSTSSYHRIRIRGALNENQFSLRDGQSGFANCIAVPSLDTNGTNLTDPACFDYSYSHIWRINAK